MKASSMGILSIEGGIRLVKGISRQVIVVQPQNQKMFDQAIFILKDHAIGKEGVTDEQLLREAGCLLQNTPSKKKRKIACSGLLWAGCGALLTGLIWLLTAAL